jgi:hypothetical protein
VVTLSRNALVIVAVGFVVLASLHAGATDSAGSALRAVFAHLIWATTLSGGHNLQRKDS